MEKIDPYFKERLERAKHHRVLRQIDTSEFKNREVESNKDLAHPILEGSIEEFGWSEKSVNNIIDAVEKGYIAIQRIDDETIKIEFLPLSKFPQEFGHVTELKTMKENMNSGSPVFGSPEDSEYTFLQTVDFAVEGYMDDEEHGKKYTRMFVDSQDLNETRNVYLDPESLHITDYEYGHSFCVYGGVPFKAIKRVDIIMARKVKMDYPPDTDDWIDDPEAEVEKQISRFRKYVNDNFSV